MIWRCIPDAARDGAANMAIDQALLEGVQAGGRPVLRLYRWQPACLSFGRNQTARGVYDPDRAAALGVDVVRRPTGGLAVYHDRELTYAVVAPALLLGRPRAAYAAINRALATGLSALGLAASVAGSRRSAPPPLAAARHPCFGEAADGEVVANGRKLVGSAMRVVDRTILQHGSILIDGNQSEVVALQSAAAPRPTPAWPIGLREALGRVPGPTELCEAVCHGFAAAFGITFETGGLDNAECTRARELEALFRSDDWTWRR